MKLLIENSANVEILTEQTEKGKVLYLEGIFAEAELKNGNKRFYRQKIMEKAVTTYNDEYVSKRRALGEINHPDRPFPDPAKAALITEVFKMEGTKVYGKARIINGPGAAGQQLAALIEAGFGGGVSTRGLGSLEESQGIKYVQSDFMLTAVDYVDKPSGPNCYPNALMESSWVNKNGVWIPSVSMEDKNIDEAIIMEKFELWLKQSKNSIKAKNSRLK